MWWLFGQIWLWLLIAFLLGAATAALLLRPRRTRTPPPTSPEEQTERLPPARDEYRDPEPDDPARGRRSGTLPVDWPPTT
ncbi:hypothetical protein ORV05_36200 [Amycolatopsis cynarae]|uniref:Uncharacterized protein n=1 Tax=Amycolatopsis cynarae TaxID=2995223 RepID=A0ABY7B1N9_9PSEU|nr:hypothetical protein [Amycolatopsis sp. HUAS 11-8]WAL66220.1 hypothetical protein ORV05_36200 [Amycolatopsis sp. HUAS 11-8]